MKYYRWWLILNHRHVSDGALSIAATQPEFLLKKYNQFCYNRKLKLDENRFWRKTVSLKRMLKHLYKRLLKRILITIAQTYLQNACANATQKLTFLMPSPMSFNRRRRRRRRRQWTLFNTIFNNLMSLSLSFFSDFSFCLCSVCLHLSLSLSVLWFRSIFRYLSVHFVDDANDSTCHYA